MSNCKACIRRLSNLNNPCCTKCKRCYLCHQNDDGYGYGYRECSFSRSNSKFKRCQCGDNLTIKNPECEDCEKCLSCHIGQLYNDIDAPCKFVLYSKKVDKSKFVSKQFKCKRLVGVEWEYDQYKTHKGLSEIIKWAAKRKAGHHEDGSCCAEVVTAPIGGDNIKKHLTELGKIINKNVKINDSCGIHVHVDARDIDALGMDKVMWLYNKVEPLLYIIAGADRIDNEYCQPVKDLSRPNDKYYGLNIRNWVNKHRDKTTLEFRMQEGTTDTKHVIHWAQLCSSLVDYAIKSDIKKLHAMPASAVKIIRTIYPQGDKWLLECLKKYRKNHKVWDRHFLIKDGKWEWSY